MAETRSIAIEAFIDGHRPQPREVAHLPFARRCEAESALVLQVDDAAELSARARLRSPRSLRRHPCHR